MTVRRTSLRAPIEQDEIVPQSAEIYKQLYGRTVKIPSYLENEENVPVKGGKYSKRASIDVLLQKEILEFNVRKELEEGNSPSKVKLPKIASIKSPRNNSQNTTASPKLKKKSVAIDSCKKSKTKSLKLKMSPMIMTQSLSPVNSAMLSPSQKLSKFSYMQTSRLNGSPKGEASQSIFDLKSPLASTGDMDDSPIITDYKKLGKLLQSVNYRPNRNKLSKIIMKGVPMRSSSCVNGMVLQGYQGKY